MNPSAQLSAERIAVETLYRAFNEKNPDLLDEVVTPEWQDIPLAPGQGPGPAGLKPIILGLIAAFPDVHIQIHDLIQTPGSIAVRAEITGTHLGSLMGIPATGKQVSFAIHEFHHLTAGRITSTWHLEEWFGLFRQLGQFPDINVS
ncbi:ester cyclase [Erwinia sp. P7711]|uniref:ester cyclase n=1 Tax=Erwinia sp. P7711 TaxID=3141451 RepID=UPI003194E2C4